MVTSCSSTFNILQPPQVRPPPMFCPPSNPSPNPTPSSRSRSNRSPGQLLPAVARATALGPFGPGPPDLGRAERRSAQRPTRPDRNDVDRPGKAPRDRTQSSASQGGLCGQASTWQDTRQVATHLFWAMSSIPDRSTSNGFSRFTSIHK